jgi:hypothetical protein
VLVLLAPVGAAMSALALGALVTALLGALALSDLGARLGSVTDAPRASVDDLRLLH